MSEGEARELVLLIMDMLDEIECGNVTIEQAKEELWKLRELLPELIKNAGM